MRPTRRAGPPHAPGTRDQAGYFDLGPLDQGESTRREICRMLEEMGYEIEASHHESAAGQHEIDFKYVDAMDAADKIMTFKLAVKTIAQKNGLHATFMSPRKTASTPPSCQSPSLGRRAPACT